MRFLVVSVFVLGCGSVSETPKDAPGDTTGSNQQDAMVDAPPPCGTAGAACCASNMCNANLSCTTSDQICRASLMFIGSSNSNDGQAYVLRGNGTTFNVDPIGMGGVGPIWGTAANDVWVVASYNESGTNAQKSYARHWNGTIWETAIPLTPDGFTYAMWGSAANDYWAFTNGGAAHHWTGSSWGTLQAIDGSDVYTTAWGSSATNIYAFAQNRQSHFDGVWTSTTLADFSGSRASGIRATNELWAGGSDPGGYNPEVLHIDGATRTVDTLSTDQNCQSVVGIWAGKDDVWAISAGLFNLGQCTLGPRTFHRTTSSWAEVTTGIPAWQAIGGMWGTSSNDVYVSGKNAAGEVTVFHYDGTTWTPTYSTTAVTSAGQMWGPGGTN